MVTIKRVPTRPRIAVVLYKGGAVGEAGVEINSCGLLSDVWEHLVLPGLGLLEVVAAEKLRSSPDEGLSVSQLGCAFGDFVRSHGPVNA